MAIIPLTLYVYRQYICDAWIGCILSICLLISLQCIIVENKSIWYFFTLVVNPFCWWRKVWFSNSFLSVISQSAVKYIQTEPKLIQNAFQDHLNGPIFRWSSIHVLKQILATAKFVPSFGLNFWVPVKFYKKTLWLLFSMKHC